ncbi:MAG TPA: Imm53 family immunity protein [Bacteroidota bacterium]|nr:Imm53 family immunity protein [Bacteroidota bacterium]
MADANTVLSWLESWLQCQNQNERRSPCEVEIETVGELGWHITIHVADTPYESINIPAVSAENTDSDWYYYRMYDSRYEASGDPSKLEFLLQQFIQIIGEATTPDRKQSVAHAATSPYIKSSS